MLALLVRFLLLQNSLYREFLKQSFESAKLFFKGFFLLKLALAPLKVYSVVPCVFT